MKYKMEILKDGKLVDSFVGDSKSAQTWGDNHKLKNGHGIVMICNPEGKKIEAIVSKTKSVITKAKSKSQVRPLDYVILLVLAGLLVKALAF